MTCADCGTPIYECMGFTYYEDYVRADHEEIPFSEVRVLCGSCVERMKALLNVSSKISSEDLDPRFASVVDKHFWELATSEKEIKK